MSVYGELILIEPITYVRMWHKIAVLNYREVESQTTFNWDDRQQHTFQSEVLQWSMMVLQNTPETRNLIFRKGMIAL